VRTEFAALRTVPGFRRALALALAFSGFLAISYLGLKELDTTTLTDARSALSSGAIAGLVTIVYAAATAGGEVARGGLATALIMRRDRRLAVRDRLAAYAAAGACLGLAGALMAAALTYLLLGFGGAELPGAGVLLTRALGSAVYGALMGVAGAALGLAARSAAPPVVVILAVLLFLEPLFAGLSDPVARWGPGGAAGALTASSTEDLPPAWAGALVLLAYAGLAAALATTLTARRDVP
jgi:ABC-2 type transport system permease protein